MEPLSALSSIITVIGTAKAISKGLGRLKGLGGAPEELKDLLEDVSRFKSVVEGIGKCPVVQIKPLAHLQVTLQRANEQLLEIDKLVQYSLTKAGESDQVDRWQWVSKKGSVAKA